jgi:hypothetical protein
VAGEHLPLNHIGRQTTTRKFDRTPAGPAQAGRPGIRQVTIRSVARRTRSGERRHGEAIALLDFDYAAPGRRLYDLARLAKMCFPLDTPEAANRLGLGDMDPFSPPRGRRRLRASPGREALVDAVRDAVTVGDQFVRRHVQAGETGFVAVWEASSGEARMARRRR